MRTRWIYGLVLIAAIAFVATEAGAQAAPGALFIESNSQSENTILKFNRLEDGRIQPAGEFSTGGKGTGAGLGNAGALALSRDDRFIFAVNAGSNDISVLAITEGGLRLIDRKPSGGLYPISVTENHGIVYVLNNGSAAGGVDNISGFRVSKRGYLTAISGSTRPLSAPAVAPAQVRFDEEGETLIVTEKNTNIIDTYSLNEIGLANGPSSIPSNGATPFGFAVGKRGQVFVTDAAGGTPNASALSAYELSDTGLHAIGGASATHQTSACWAATTHDGRFVYTANTGSNTISGFSIGHDGRVTLLNADGRTAPTEGAPADLGFSNGDRFLYVVNGASHSISGFRVFEDGSLSPVGGFSGLPAGTTGLAVH
jgi:6-phosphogluconolactonase